MMQFDRLNTDSCCAGTSSAYTRIMMKNTSKVDAVTVSYLAANDRFFDAESAYNEAVSANNRELVATLRLDLARAAYAYAAARARMPR